MIHDQIPEMGLRLIGHAVRMARKERNITQAELAESVGTNQQHIAAFEGGKVNLAMKTFLAILAALNMHMDLSLKDGDKPAGFPVVSKN